MRKTCKCTEGCLVSSETLKPEAVLEKKIGSLATSETGICHECTTPRTLRQGRHFLQDVDVSEVFFILHILCFLLYLTPNAPPLVAPGGHIPEAV